MSSLNCGAPDNWETGKLGDCATESRKLATENGKRAIRRPSTIHFHAINFDLNEASQLIYARLKINKDAKVMAWWCVRWANIAAGISGLGFYGMLKLGCVCFVCFGFGYLGVSDILYSADASR